MSSIQVSALYDFDAQPGTAELSLRTGEILVVTSKDVGEGWWEGYNTAGQSGIFPAAYVEEVSATGPPTLPPPPLPTGYEEEPADGGQYDDDWDDDWDDDSEGGGSQQFSSVATPSAPGPRSITASVNDPSLADTASIGKGTIGPRKNLNRFSTFVKTGGESYILGTKAVNVPEAEKIYIMESSDGTIFWSPPAQPFGCVITSPKKESKLKGLKSFIAYQLTPSFNNIQVSRRYKHFDWLHERLEEKYCLIPIPPLPDKQISGRYEDQFVEHRRLQLQSFVDRVCRHPVLSQAAVLHHFLSCTDAKLWKTGKRKAEKDERLGANLFVAIQAPERPLDPVVVEARTETFGRFVTSFDASVRHLSNVGNDQVKKFQGPMKREWQRVGQSFQSLALAMDMDSDVRLGSLGPKVQALTSALRHTGDTYDRIGNVHEDQPRNDWEPLGDLLHDYKGLLNSWPDILNVHKGAVQKRKETERLALEGKADTAQVNAVAQRSDVVTYALLAEIHNFHSERLTDFSSAMKSFLQQQIFFYQKIVQELQTTLQQYDNL